MQNFSLSLKKNYEPCFVDLRNFAHKTRFTTSNKNKN